MQLICILVRQTSGGSLTIQAAYALMLLVPVILTLAVFGLARLFAGAPVAGTWLGVGGFVLLAVLGVIGLPYVVFAASFAAWAHGRSLQTVQRAANLAPLIFWLFVLVTCTWTVGLKLKLLAWLSVLVLGIGYLWVMLAHALVRWLMRRQIILDAA